MKFKLFYKFFGIIFLSILLSLLTAAVTIGYFGKKNFHRYLEKTKVKEFSTLAVNIGKYYEAHGSLEKLISKEVPLHIAFMAGDREMAKDLGSPDAMEAMPRFPKEHEVFTFYDTDMRYLAGGQYPPEDMHIFPVVADNKPVAYFGVLKFRKLPPNPFAEKFLESQIYLLMITTLIVMVLATLTALWLTRNMLAPLRELNIATRRVAERDFDVDVEIGSNDELADLADNFNVMTNTLKEYELSQARWISDISHELRTPLSVILGSIEAIQDGVRKPDFETIESVYQNTIRMKRLVNELHDITLAESGVMHLQKVSVDIAHELASLLDFYEVRLAEFRFSISFESYDEDIMVQVDLVRLNQVFINILENAIKYAKSPGVLYVQCVVDGDDVLISFEDTGPGVSEEHLPRLFDRLYRVDSSRSRATGGSGLGLSICKYIIENHGGSVSACKGKKGGLRLEIRLPLEK
ncbi:integral membrane sensor signal transduction histidine kinase [Denitrovibrio acetiphilus DSM 12809]|uniref:histidine kinase n=1 Tax=Denitrovibrio acetiphilus (strain DSM 12809 / NBRC 114555 / N2460) TaxID=522772 RepID=D4H1P6_DENA2|nr:integral membrane sensor signal transduction histidine kinase [Denitrovibrio acetiphilus DSM 12809]